MLDREVVERAVLACACLLAGCTVSGTVDLETSPKLIACTDTRDGERFDYRPENVTNVRLGLAGADTCLDLRDEAGRQRTICTPEAVYIKCEPADDARLVRDNDAKEAT